MRVRDLRFEQGGGKMLNATWSHSQIFRSRIDPNHTFLAYKNDESPGKFSICHIDSKGMYAGDYMNSIEKFELACIIAGMEPIT